MVIDKKHFGISTSRSSSNEIKLTSACKRTVKRTLSYQKEIDNKKFRWELLN